MSNFFRARQKDSLEMLGLQVSFNGRNAGKHLQTDEARVFYFEVDHLNVLTQVGTAWEGPGMGAWGEVAEEQGNRNRVLILIVAGVAGLIFLMTPSGSRQEVRMSKDRGRTERGSWSCQIILYRGMDQCSKLMNKLEFTGLDMFIFIKLNKSKSIQVF